MAGLAQGIFGAEETTFHQMVHHRGSYLSKLPFVALPVVAMSGMAATCFGVAGLMENFADITYNIYNVSISTLTSQKALDETIDLSAKIKPIINEEAVYRDTLMTTTGLFTWMLSTGAFLMLSCQRCCMPHSRSS